MSSKLVMQVISFGRELQSLLIDKVGVFFVPNYAAYLGTRLMTSVPAPGAFSPGG